MEGAPRPNKKTTKEAKRKAKEERKAKALAKAAAGTSQVYKTLQDFREERKPQDFDYFCVLDFEAVRKRKSNNPGLKETEDEASTETKNEDDHEDEWIYEATEFPVVLVNAKTLACEAEFHRYCKPQVIDSEYVNRYIQRKYGRFGKSEDWFDTCVSFGAALEELEAWLKEKSLLDQEQQSRNEENKFRFAFVICGDWDFRHLLPRNCSLYGLQVPYFMQEWVNIKTIYAQFYHKRRPPAGMRNMLDEMGIPLEGLHHYGIHDCRNIAKVVVRLIEDGCKLSITNRMVEYLSYEQKETISAE
jgi:inhibitor of KinA sporulation pathway (predicted exonuclease)